MMRRGLFVDKSRCYFVAMLDMNQPDEILSLQSPWFDISSNGWKEGQHHVIHHLRRFGPGAEMKYLDESMSLLHHSASLEYRARCLQLTDERHRADPNDLS